MMQLQVLLVAGTHGNEINGIFLFEQWEKLPLLINTYGIKTQNVIGNPEAKKAGKRYIHKDLNRSFEKESNFFRYLDILINLLSSSSIYLYSLNLIYLK